MTLPSWIVPGARFRLIEMGADDPCPVAPGSTGTITQVVDLSCIGEPGDYQFWVDWDPEVGRSLNIAWPVDRIEPWRSA